MLRIVRSVLRTTLLLLVALILGGSSAVRAADGTAVGQAMIPGEPEASGENEGNHSGLRTAFLASTFLLGSVATILEIESDRAYSRYLDVADPARMDTNYDRAERYRDLSSAALVGAELCAIAFVVLALNERPPKEGEPGTVRITFDVGTSGVGVRLLW